MGYVEEGVQVALGGAFDDALGAGEDLGAGLGVGGVGVCVVGGEGGVEKEGGGRWEEGREREGIISQNT